MESRFRRRVRGHISFTGPFGVQVHDPGGEHAGVGDADGRGQRRALPPERAGGGGDGGAGRVT